MIELLAARPNPEPLDVLHAAIRAERPVDRGDDAVQGVRRRAPSLEQPRQHARRIHLRPDQPIGGRAIDVSAAHHDRLAVARDAKQPTPIFGRWGADIEAAFLEARREPGRKQISVPVGVDLAWFDTRWSEVA